MSLMVSLWPTARSNTTGFVCQVLTERVAALRQRADEHRGIAARTANIKL